MSHDKYSIDLAVLAKLRHEDLQREAEQYRLAELARASQSIRDPISRGVSRLRQLLARIRAEQPILKRQDELVK